MSRLSEMIARLCPNGVEYRKLGEIATIERGNGLQKSDFKPSGIPCIHYGQLYTKFNTSADSVLTYVSEETAKSLKRLHKGDILMAVTSENVEDVCRCIAWLGDGDVVVGGHTAIIRHTQNPKYLAYWFQTEDFFLQKKRLAHGTKVIEVTPKTLESITIPLPPLEIQREVVEILDNFAQLTAELTAELAKRKKQYEHYRDMLLNFEGADIEWKKLGEICDVKTGGEPPLDAIKGKLPIGGNVYPIYANGIGDNALWGFSADTVINRDAVTFSSIGTIGHPTIRKAGFTPIIRLKVIYPKDEQVLCLGFLKYVLEVIEFKQQKSSLPNVNASMIKSIAIPLPPLAEQKRIVAILDRFDSLCNSLTEGLPAEIALRKKQYEYYRDKLLSFKEAS